MLMAKGKLLGVGTEIRGPKDGTWEAKVVGVLVKTGDIFDTESPMYLDIDDKEYTPEVEKLIEANVGNMVMVNLTVGGRAYKSSVILAYRFQGFAQIVDQSKINGKDMGKAA
jgi:hypothetical protein